ncbi:MAG: response regulator [Burkholderiales bacterium]
MKIASIPKEEVARIAALSRYAILDSAREAVFDGITQLASTICDSPIALISLVDGDRQWFKSKVGVEASQTPRDYAFCAHAILGDEILIVPDALQDERFHDNPLVTSAPSVRFYAGAPLTTEDGFNLGTLCVIDSKPRQLNDAQMGVLKLLATQVIHLFESRKRIMDLAEASDQLLQRNQDYVTILDNLPSMLFIKDAENLRFEYVNRAWGELFALPPDGVIGKSALDLFPASQAEMVNVADRRSLRLTDGIEVTENLLQTPHGPRVLHTQKVALRDVNGVPRALVGISTDITEREQMMQDLAVVKASAEAANRAKSAFLASMSHEIRTPMNAIMGMTQLALNSDLNPGQRHYLDAVYSSAESLLSILNDILDLSKIEAGKLTIEHLGFNLDKEVEALKSMMGATAHARGLNLQFDIGAQVPRSLNGDPTRIRQILTNLIGNAVKFTSMGRVILRIVVLETQEEARRIRLRFEVSDTGIGLNQEQIAGLFERFSQADSSITRRFGGTGLGLAISKNLVELMHGEIGIESQVGQGSTFHFSIWLGLGDSGVLEEAPVADDFGMPLAGLRVLVVDDLDLNRELVRAILEGADVVVSEAGNGREALTLLEGSPEAFDAVFMDLHMPVMDGIDATRRIRQNPALRSIPIIALTADAMIEDKQRCLDAGMNGYVSKPFRTVDLYASLGGIGGARPGSPG